MGVEFFEMENGDLIVNEIAPRVHNSGHWTQDAGCIDQFELHIRAIAGWPLGEIKLQHNVEMTNLIGRDIDALNDLAKVWPFAFSNCITLPIRRSKNARALALSSVSSASQAISELPITPDRIVRFV